MEGRIRVPRGVGRLDETVKYEDVGYVMSGSRHRRMNVPKENQVISAEEKRGILKLQKEGGRGGRLF
jgi:NF-kappa-B-activating protein C-terminal domain